jgi:hypothetical protein
MVVLKSEQKDCKFILPGHLCSPPVFSGIRVTQSLVLYVCFVDGSSLFLSFDIRILITPLVSYIKDQ